jgi:hypothetical protein
MKLPVFAVARAAMGDFARFVIRHPLAVLVAIAGSILLDRWLGPAYAGSDRPTSLAGVAQSGVSVLAQLLVWLPLRLVAVREVVSGQVLPLRLGGLPSPATQRYALYNAAVMLAAESVSLIDGSAPVAGIVALAFAVGAAWFSLRSTLTFTSLALGKLDLGFARSIERTRGQTLRLLAILLLPLAVFIAAALAVMLVALANGADPDPDLPDWSALAVVAAQLFLLTAAIAGAQVYRRLEAAPPQNGRY